jgi:magnesium-protoporphyrin O-methyltransferase
MMALAERWLDATTPTPWTDRQALDAGCGTGLFSMALARRGMQVRSVDIAPQMVEATRRNAATCRPVSPIGSKRLPVIWRRLDGDFDLVCCFDVLIHYPSEAFVPICLRIWPDVRTRYTVVYLRPL